MSCKYLQKRLYDAKHLRGKTNGALQGQAMMYHRGEENHQEPLPCEWYEKVSTKMRELSQVLKNVDSVDGMLVDVGDNSIIVDDSVEQKMRTFKSIARVLIGSPSSQRRLKENVLALSAGSKCSSHLCFGKESEREPMVIDSLNKVSSFLNISAQQRKVVRSTICPQVTQHRVWTCALVEILNGLSHELDLLHKKSPGKGTFLGQQIVSSCLEFLNGLDRTVAIDEISCSWMRPAPVKGVDSSALKKWGDVLEMCNDLLWCLRREQCFLPQLTKLEAMKEGLSQIKDVLVDNRKGYKESQHHNYLVQKKLTKTLGHSSKCLFTLLLYYLYGYVRDLEVDLCGGIYNCGNQEGFRLSMGRILTSNEDTMAWRGVKQLDKALGLFEFVRETAGMKGVLELQGHLWCIGADCKKLEYRGKTFFVHDMCV